MRATGRVEAFRRVQCEDEEEEGDAAQDTGVEDNPRHFEVYSNHRHRGSMFARRRVGVHTARFVQDIGKACLACCQVR